MGLIKVESQNECKMYAKYVVRDGELYRILNEKDINPDEIFVGISSTPSTPPDLVLYRAVNTPEYVNPDFSWPHTDLSEVINMDYFNPEGIKNYLLDIGEFKNWYDE